MRPRARPGSSPFGRRRSRPVGTGWVFDIDSTPVSFGPSRPSTSCSLLAERAAHRGAFHLTALPSRRWSSPTNLRTERPGCQGRATSSSWASGRRLRIGHRRSTGRPPRRQRTCNPVDRTTPRIAGASWWLTSRTPPQGRVDCWRRRSNPRGQKRPSGRSSWPTRRRSSSSGRLRMGSCSCLPTCIDRTYFRKSTNCRLVRPRRRSLALRTIAHTALVSPWPKSCSRSGGLVWARRRSSRATSTPRWRRLRSPSCPHTLASRPRSTASSKPGRLLGHICHRRFRRNTGYRFELPRMRTLARRTTRCIAAACLCSIVDCPWAGHGSWRRGSTREAPVRARRGRRSSPTPLRRSA